MGVAQLDPFGTGSVISSGKGICGFYDCRRLSNHLCWLVISSGITNIILPLTVSGDDNQLLEEFGFVVCEVTLLLVGKALFATTLASSNSRILQGIIQVKLFFGIVVMLVLILAQFT